MSQAQKGGLFSWGKLQDAQTGNANGTAIDCTQQAIGAMTVLTAQVVGAGFTGTVNFEGTVDGTNWVALSGTDLASAAAAATATAGGIFRFTVLGLLKFRARTSGVSAGNVTVAYTLVG